MILPDSFEEVLVSAERDGTLIAFVTKNELRRERGEPGAKLSELQLSMMSGPAPP